MKMTYGLALAAALAFGCSSGSKSTRTAGNDTGTTQSGSISGTQGTASSQQGTVGGSASTQTDTGTVGGTSGSASTSGAVASSTDNSNLRTVTGSVAKVDENSITLDQAAGGGTLTIDSQTQVIRRGKPVAGISSIREGEQVRASFDPASNRAEKIEVMGKAKMHRQHKAVGSDQPAPPPGDATGK